MADDKYAQGLAGLKALSEAEAKAPGAEADAEASFGEPDDQEAGPATQSIAASHDLVSRRGSATSQAEVMTMADSEEVNSDGADSDYGLSDRQFVEIWDKFQEGNEDLEAVSFLAASFTGIADVGGESASQEGMSFMMITPSAAKAAEAAGDDSSPRQALGRGPRQGSMRSQGSKASHGSPRSLGKGVRTPLPEVPEQAAIKAEDKALTIGDLPEAAIEREHGANANLRISLVSSRQIDRVTWYLWKVEEGNDVRLYMKRFNDFKKLDQELRTKGNAAIKLIDLPPSGRFGLRHKFNLGGFNDQRREGLARYIQQIVMQIDGLAQEPMLKKFFGSKASGRILPNVGEI